MLHEIDLISGIKKLISLNNIISISGPSGTGKTTLSLHLVGNLLKHNEPLTDSCIWIQASEIFPKKRLEQLFENNLEKLQYLQNNIFIKPIKRPIKSLEEQNVLIENLIAPTTLLPPSLKYIVIDNISHHLRYSLQHTSNAFKLVNRFYDEQLLPLILFCNRENIRLFLIHEVTYSPKLNCIRPFFYKLYNRIKMIDIILKNMLNDKRKIMKISSKNYQWKFHYTLGNSGIEIV